MAKTRGVQPNEEIRNTAVLDLYRAEGPLTRADLGVSAYFVKQLTEAGWVEHVVKDGKLQTRKVTNSDGKAQAGRPSPLLKLTKKGRDKARRLAAKPAELAMEPTVIEAGVVSGDPVAA